MVFFKTTSIIKLIPKGYCLSSGKGTYYGTILVGHGQTDSQMCDLCNYIVPHPLQSLMFLLVLHSAAVQL